MISQSPELEWLFWIGVVGIIASGLWYAISEIYHRYKPNTINDRKYLNRYAHNKEMEETWRWGDMR